MRSCASFPSGCSRHVTSEEHHHQLLPLLGCRGARRPLAPAARQIPSRPSGARRHEPAATGERQADGGAAAAPGVRALAGAGRAPIRASASAGCPPSRGGRPSHGSAKGKEVEALPEVVRLRLQQLRTRHHTQRQRRLRLPAATAQRVVRFLSSSHPPLLHIYTFSVSECYEIDYVISTCDIHHIPLPADTQ